MDTQIIVKDYQSGSSLNQISELYGISYYKLKSLLKREGIPIRSRREANILENQKRSLKVDEHFFKTWSSNMAYILGFLYADGYISPKRNLIEWNISKIDVELLEKIKETMNIERDIKFYLVDEKFETAKLSFSSSIIKGDLSELGLASDKTFNPQIINIPKEYFIDFFRGYFDGDGSIGMHGDKQIRLRICSAMPTMLKYFVSQLYDLYDIPQVGVNHSRPNYYEITYSTNSSLKIFDLLYYKNCLCLKRKQDKFNEILNKRI